MKKYIILTATLIAALCSCTKNETTPVISDENTPIAFQAMGYAAQTKAAGAFTNSDFAVYGYQHSSAWATAKTATGNDAPSLLMNKVVVTHNNGSIEAYSDINNGDVWAPSEVYYWPKQDFLTFGAYSPSTVTTATFDFNKGITFSEFTVNTLPGNGNKIDLLYSDTASDKTISNYKNGSHQSNPEGVYLLFHHALAQLSISAEFSGKVNPGTTAAITITKIQLKSIDTKGTGFNATDKTWESSVSKDQNLNVTAKGIDSGSAKGFISGYYVMPQTLTADKQQFLISYTITTTFADHTTKTETIIDRAVDITSSSIGAWEPNNKYSYNLLISAVSDDPITFDPAVESWVEE